MIMRLPLILIERQSFHETYNKKILSRRSTVIWKVFSVIIVQYNQKVSCIAKWIRKNKIGSF